MDGTYRPSRRHIARPRDGLLIAGLVSSLGVLGACSDSTRTTRPPIAARTAASFSASPSALHVSTISFELAVESERLGGPTRTLRAHVVRVAEAAGWRTTIMLIDDARAAKLPPGPFRLKFSESAAEDAANTLINLGLIIELDGYHIEDAIDPQDGNAIEELEIALGLQDLGFFFNDFCPIDWNYNIVGSGANDGVVPWESQVMPNSQTAFLKDVAHTEETSQATEIRTALDLMTGRS